VDAEAAAVPAQRPPASSDARLAIIDVAAPWRAVSLETHGVRIVTPEAASSLVDASSPHPILVNLAAPGALAAMAALRAAGATVSFLAYVAVAGTEKALRLGTTEVVGAPMDPDAVLAVLDGHVTRGTRVLAAGADADAVMSLRQALSRQGASVSMAWDCNQAKDLLAMTRPAVAVIDLDLPPRGGYALVAALADLDPLPTAVLVCQPGAEGGARLAAEAADRSRAARLVALQQLLNDLLRRG
jgi:DNA-binding response OmpR family regulator